MWVIFKLAVRNLSRNKRRTLLSACAMGIGLASLIFVDALNKGMTENMIRAATDFFPGQAQIHRKGFLDTYEVEDVISDSGQMVKRLKKEAIVKSFAPRAIGQAMLASTTEISAVLLYGIDPAGEKKISRIHETLVQGTFLNESKETNRIVIGRKLADILNVGLGDRVVVTVARAHSGELSQELFRVSGIFDINISDIDSSMAFVKIGELQKLLNVGNGIHEIAMDFDDIMMGADEKNGFWAKYSTDGNEALGWSRLFHDLDSLIKMSRYAVLLTAILLFGVVAIGVVNTLFMSLYERMFEIGIMRALGTRPFSMGIIVVFETWALTFLSTIIGIIAALAVILWLSKTGIDYRGYEFNGVTIKDMIYPVTNWYQFVIYPALLFLFTTVVGLYPAIYSAMLTPARAMLKYRS